MNEEQYMEIVSQGIQSQEEADQFDQILDLSINELTEAVTLGELNPADAIDILLYEADPNASTDKWHKKVTGGITRIAKSAWEKMPQGLQNAAPWKLWLGGATILIAGIGTGFGIKWLAGSRARKIAMAAANKIKMMAEAEGIEADRAVMQYSLKKLQKDRYIKMKLKNILNVHGGGREQLAMDRASEFLAREAMKIIRQKSGPRLPKIVPPPSEGTGPSERGFVHPPGHEEPQMNLDMAQGVTQGTEFIGGNLMPAAMDQPMGEEAMLYEDEYYDQEEEFEFELDPEVAIDAVLEGYSPDEVSLALLEKKAGLGRAILKGVAKGAAAGGAAGMGAGGVYGGSKKGSTKMWRKITSTEKGRASTQKAVRDMSSAGFSRKGKKRLMRASTGAAGAVKGGAIGAGIGAVAGGAHAAYKHLKGKKKKKKSKREDIYMPSREYQLYEVARQQVYEKKGGLGRAMLKGAAAGGAAGTALGLGAGGAYGASKRGSTKMLRGVTSTAKGRQSVADLATSMSQAGMSRGQKKKMMRGISGVAHGVRGGMIGAGLGMAAGAGMGAYKHLKGKKKKKKGKREDVYMPSVEYQLYEKAKRSLGSSIARGAGTGALIGGGIGGAMGVPRGAILGAQYGKEMHGRPGAGAVGGAIGGGIGGSIRGGVLGAGIGAGVGAYKHIKGQKKKKKRGKREDYMLLQPGQEMDEDLKEAVKTFFKHWIPYYGTYRTYKVHLARYGDSDEARRAAMADAILATSKAIPGLNFITIPISLAKKISRIAVDANLDQDETYWKAAKKARKQKKDPSEWKRILTSIFS